MSINDIAKGTPERPMRQYRHGFAHSVARPCKSAHGYHV